MKINIRLLYLYLFSFVGLLITAIGSIQIVELALKVYLFTEADAPFYAYTLPPESQAGKEEVIQNQQEEKTNHEQFVKSERQRNAANAIAMIMVGTPLYLYHWKEINPNFLTTKKPIQKKGATKKTS